MTNLTTLEVKAFVPAKDFNLSKQFYRDFGFNLAWADDHLAEFRHGDSSFLLQNFYEEAHAGNFMMHLLVEDVDAWWQQVQDQGLMGKYRVHSEPPTDRGQMRDFVLVDPTRVLWRIAQNLPKAV
jgi:catechol 2,3-dioxygenase-like lactoylglutathione lyase family enzyme